MSDIHVRLHKNILWLVLDKPPLNSLTLSMLEQLTMILCNAIKQPPYLTVITGMGERAFCAGVELPDDSDNGRVQLLRAASEVSTAFEELHAHNIATVALVKGSAFGPGCELVALCDTVIAREEAVFRLPAINAKIFPSVLSVSLPASIGQEATTHLVQSGETLNAREAMRLGLVHQVLPAHRFLLDTEELLIMLASLR